MRNMRNTAVYAQLWHAIVATGLEPTSQLAVIHPIQYSRPATRLYLLFNQKVVGKR
jgi:hypothetical protein